MTKYFKINIKLKGKDVTCTVKKNNELCMCARIAGTNDTERLRERERSPREAIFLGFHKKQTKNSYIC